MKRTILTHILALLMGGSGGVLGLAYIDNQAFAMYQDQFDQCIEVAKDFKSRLYQTESMMSACIEQYAEAASENEQCSRALKQCIKIEFDFPGKKGK